jgi:esterase/lipase superfamily enzyme
LALGACGSRVFEGSLVPVTQQVEGTARVPILVATTRQKSTTAKGVWFGGERGAATSYASVVVSIPPDAARKIGEVQWPTSLPGNPARDFVTVSADYLERKAFAAAIAAEAKRTGRSKVLVFVHGFNNRFDEAVYRFAQIHHDAKAPSIPVLFTWPSRGEVLLRSYTYDRDSATYSRDALEELLDMLAAYPNITEVAILAHSMGNWLVLEALRGRALRMAKVTSKAKVDKLKNAMLVAPDVDVDVFRTQIARMGTNRPKFLLFVSQDDGALKASRFIGGDVQRLGDVNPAAEPYRGEFERSGIEVFDLTKLGGGDAHGRAFEEVDSVVGMIKQRMNQGQALATPSSPLDSQIEQIANVGR